MEPWVQGLVELAEIQPDDRVLDVGCGPGFVARRAAELVGKTGR
ncbi:MAG TPA: methyltransferase type 11, partial [Dehalococcoidia bacterium]|nr:methyltransferase type 11 [Dehalococcoidia bacterium]